MNGKILSILDNNGKDQEKDPFVGRKPKPFEKNKKKSSSKKWTIFILVLIAIGFWLIWFLNRDKGQIKDDNFRVTITAPKNYASEQPMYQDREEVVIESGTYSFEMEEGEETIWIKLSTDRSFIYEIGSPGDEWIIYYSDGTVLKGSENSILPTKEKVVFKIKSLKKQTINLIIY